MRSSSEESDCAICLENKTGEVAKLSCGHTYHYNCIEEWVTKKQNFLKCCCICEQNTEIVNIIGEDEYQETFIENTQVENTQVENTQVENTNLINNPEINYYDSYLPTENIVYINMAHFRNRVAPIRQDQYNEQRYTRPGFFDMICCSIL